MKIPKSDIFKHLLTAVLIKETRECPGGPNLDLEENLIELGKFYKNMFVFDYISSLPSSSSSSSSEISEEEEKKETSPTTPTIFPYQVYCQQCKQFTMSSHVPTSEKFANVCLTLGCIVRSILTYADFDLVDCLICSNQHHTMSIDNLSKHLQSVTSGNLFIVQEDDDNEEYTPVDSSEDDDDSGGDTFTNYLLNSIDLQQLAMRSGPTAENTEMFFDDDDDDEDADEN